MKKHMVKKAVAFSLASLMAVNCSMTMVCSGAPWITGLSAHAADKTSGTCGTGLKWELDSAGVLTISGSGEMTDWTTGAAPWEDHVNVIQKIVIEEGVTSIGVNAFAGLSNATEAHIPDSVGKINAGAFKDCKKLSDVHMSPAVRTIVKTAFDGTDYSSRYYTSYKMPGMQYGAASEMTGKQVVVNIFLNELTGVLPDLEKEKSEWEEVPAEIKKDFDSYDLENYYYDFFYSHVYRIPKEKLTYTLTSAWTQGFTPTTEENATAISLDKVNYTEHLSTGKNTLPQDEYFANTPVYSDMMKQRLVLVDRALERLEADAAEYETDLEFVTDTKLNYYFTYNRWQEGVKEFLFQGVEPYKNMILGNRPKISSDLNSGGLHSDFADTGEGTANVMEQFKTISNNTHNLFRNEYSQYSDFVMKIKQDYKADGVVILFHLYSPSDTGYAVPSTGAMDENNKGEEFAMIYQNNVDVIKDQICALYGAQPTHDKELDLSKETTSIKSDKKTLMMYNEMHYGKGTSQNGLMAYYLGWCDKVEKEVYDLLVSDKNYGLGDLNMNGKLDTEDKKLLSGHIKGKSALSPMQKMLAGDNLAQNQTIKGWTDQLIVQPMESNPDYIQFSTNDSEGFCIQRSDVDFDTAITAEDDKLYRSYQDGTASPTYFQEKLLPFVEKIEYAKKFIDGVNNWSFDNSDSYFSSKYDMDPKYWAILENKVSFSDFIKIQDEADEWWWGSCQGMSVTSILGYYGILDPSVYDKNADCVHDLKMTTEIRSLINYYHLLQHTSEMDLQSYFNSSTSEKEKLQILLDRLSDGSPTLLAYADPRTRRGHVVVAYGVEYGEFVQDGKQFEGKIITYDCNNKNYSDKYCMYFNLDKGEWYIPEYKNKYGSHRGDKITDIIDDIDLLNHYGYLDGTPEVVNGNYTASLKSAALTSAHTLTKSSDRDDVSLGGSSDDGITPACVFSEASSSAAPIVYFMEDEDASYLFRTEENEALDVRLKYENSLLTAKGSNASILTFSPEGSIVIEGEDTDFELDIVLDEGYTVTDWFGMTVKGGKTDKAVLEATEGGYLLTCEDMTDITVNGYHHGISINAAFTTAYDTVFLHEIDEYTIGVSVDTDEDGVYEKLIAKSKPGVAGDLNNDGTFTVTDAVAFQRWILTDGTKIINSRNADFCKDGVLDAFDLSIMKRKLIEK